jgi:uncharacterized membrane protein YvlD (DUF360 family)
MSGDMATILCLWIVMSFPITYKVNKRLEQNNDSARYETGFQIFLFIRALIEVPRFYIRPILQFLTKRN